MRIWVLNSRTATALQLHMCTKGQPWHIDSGDENHFCYDFLFTRNFWQKFLQVYWCTCAVHNKVLLVRLPKSNWKDVLCDFINNSIFVRVQWHFFFCLLGRRTTRTLLCTPHLHKNTCKNFGQKKGSPPSAAKTDGAPHCTSSNLNIFSEKKLPWSASGSQRPPHGKSWHLYGPARTSSLF